MAEHEQRWEASGLSPPTSSSALSTLAHMGEAESVFLSTKICTKCHEEKELAKFHKKPKGVLGVDSHCKKCVGLRKKAKKARQAKAKRANSIRQQNRPSKVLNVSEYKVIEKYVPIEEEQIRDVIKDFIERVICHRIQL